MFEQITARWERVPRSLRGILWAALAGLILTVLNSVVRGITLQMHPLAVSFWRYLFGAVAMLPLILPAGLTAFRTRRPSNHLVRNVVHTSGLMIWYFALPLIPIAETTALGFTTPLFITIGAVFFLGEKVGIRRWMAVAFGFVGMLIILRPGFASLSTGSLLMLASAPLFAVSNLMAKAVASIDSITSVVAWQTTLITLLCLPVALLHWSWPDPWQFVLLALSGVLGTLGNLALSQSYRDADITAVQPVGFLTLVWATMIGYAMFGDRPDLWTWAGAAVIFGANTYISHREAVRRGRSDLSGDAPPSAT